MKINRENRLRFYYGCHVVMDAMEDMNKKRKIEKKAPIGVCVKVSSLRPRHPDLEAWMKNNKHELVCRHGRVFVGSGETKHVFHYPTHEFSNPFTVKEYGLEECLRLFENHLTEMLKDESVRKRFQQLGECEEIGCFCNPGSKCHRDVILRKLNAIKNE